MAKRPTLSTLASGFRSSNKLNENFTAIDTAFDNTISRDGSTPNTMLADFDLNGNKVINAAAATQPTDLVRLQEVQDYLATVNGLIGNAYTLHPFEGTVARSISEKLDDFVNVKDFGAVGDNVNDDTEAFRTAIRELNGRKLFVPEGDWVISSTIEIDPTAMIDVTPSLGTGAFAPGFRMEGAGMVNTRFRNRVVGGPMFAFNVTNPTPYAFRSAQGIQLSNFAIVGSSAYSASSGLKFFNAHSTQLSQLHIRSLTGTAIKMTNGEQPDDGWNMFNAQNLWIEACATAGDGFGIDATGLTTKNEGSFTHLKHVFIQGCGKNQYFTVTDVAGGVTTTVTLSLNQIPAVSGVTAHPFVEGDRIKLFGLRSSRTLGANPIATTIGSATVTITATAHGFSVGDLVNFANATAVGGLTIDGDYIITSVATNTYTIRAASNATSTATGGGVSVLQTAPMVGLNDTIFHVGPNPTDTTLVLYNEADVDVDSSGMGTFARKSVAINNNPFNTLNGSTTVVVTDTAHGFKAGHMVTFTGGVDVNGVDMNGEFRITALGDRTGADTANKYQVTATTTATGTGDGGGASVLAIYESMADHAELGYYEPRSGALSWKGQLLRLDQCGFTVNQNCAFFVPGDAGLGIGVEAEQVSWENSFRRHVFVTGVTNFLALGCQFHGNDDYRQWRLADFDGSHYAIQAVNWQNTKVRARYGYGIAFHVHGVYVNRPSIHVRDVIWDDYDYYSQKRYVGVPFDHVPQNLSLVYTAPTLLTLRASTSLGQGLKTPLRLMGPTNSLGTGMPSVTGEWINYEHTSVNGVSCFNTVTGQSGGGALANNTLYYIYLYDSDGVARLIPDITAPVLDPSSGYMVMGGHPAYLLVGRAQTDGSAQWTNTGHAFLNPLALPGAVAGTPEWFWHNVADRKLYLKTGTLPSSILGGLYSYWPTFEASKTHDFGSIAAGATETTTITSGVTCSLGDYVTGVSLSIDAGGLLLHGYVSATNTITVVAENPTGAPIDLASATLRATYQRR